MTTKFNSKYFDNIDCGDKAYWLGFIWGDGYVSYRIRKNNNIEYNLKIDLSLIDKTHLEKFNQCLDGEYKINTYKYNKNGFKDNIEICRIFITNLHMGDILRNLYGIIPNRSNIDKILQNLPTIYYKDFIRGVFDADGSLVYYKNNITQNKYTISFLGSSQILKFIESTFINQNLVQQYVRQLHKRHPDKDGHCLSLSFTGKNNVKSIIDWLYSDSTMYLDRKYEKYINIFYNDERKVI